MMILLEILKGILISFGIMLGFLISAVVFVKLLNNSGQYKIPKLIDAFNVYLEQLKAEEKYEEIVPIIEIIDSLSKQIIPKQIDDYIIEKDSAIQLNDKSGITNVKVVTNYKIIKK